MYTGPHIIKDGLVFGYDTGYGIADNNTTTRFYPGKSTTNLLTSSGATSLDVRSDIYNNVTKTDLGNGKYRFVNDGTGSTTIRVYANVNDLVDGEYYGCSVSYEELNAGGYVHLDWCDTTNTSFTQASYGSANRIHIYGARSTYNSTFRFLDISLPVNGSVVLFDAQIESGRPSPFVNGTRSSTASLIDLKETTDINVSNVSFDSTGQPTFDGTSDYISKTRRQYTAESWSVEIIFKPTDASDTSWNGLFGGNLGQGGYWFFHSAGNLALYSSAGYLSYRSWTKANTFTVDEFHHLVITYTPATSTTGTFNLYYNGGEKTDSFSFTFANSYTLDSQYIGMGGGNRYGTNDVAVYKEYEKVLSATEIKQNFNAYKNRFDI